LGYTLLAQMDPTGTTGRVMEVGTDKGVKWEIDGLRYPVDAEVTGPNRVLIAEYLGRRVSERDFKGKVIWERPVDLPIALHRPPVVPRRARRLARRRPGEECVSLPPQGVWSPAPRRAGGGEGGGVPGGHFAPPRRGRQAGQDVPRRPGVHPRGQRRCPAERS